MHLSNDSSANLVIACCTLTRCCSCSIACCSCCSGVPEGGIEDILLPKLDPLLLYDPSSNEDEEEESKEESKEEEVEEPLLLLLLPLLLDPNQLLIVNFCDFF